MRLVTDVDAVHHRRDAAVEPDLGVRLPHPRGRLDGRAGAGLHPRQRVRLRRGGRAPRASTSTTFAPRLSFFFNAHIDFFEEIGKFRAARRIWARWLQRPLRRRRTRRSLRAAVPHPDRRRVAHRPAARGQHRPGRAAGPRRGARRHAVAAHRLATTRRWPCPPSEAARIALRTQQVIAHETGVANVADPLGGAPYVEWMTDEMERQAEEVFAHLDELGGGSMLEGVYAGDRGRLVRGRDRRRRLPLRARGQRRPPHRRRRQRLHRGRRRRRPPTCCTSTPPSRSASASGSPRCKQARDDDAVDRRTRAASPPTPPSPTANLMPAHHRRRARRYATEGEIVGALEDVFGTLHRAGGRS